MPTSIVFGFWDSRAEGYQHKHSRILLTRIDAFGVMPCEKHAVYNGPYSKDECAAVVLGDPDLAERMVDYDAQSGDEGEKPKGKEQDKKWADKMAERGFSNALSKPGSLGGVFADRIERLALISLTDIASIFCFKEPEKADPVKKDDEKQVAKKPEPDKDLTDAARRYLLALALLAESHPRSNGSYRLRSGCELLPVEKKIVLLGAGNDSKDAKALEQLCENRALLIAVASDAAERVLGIPKVPMAAVFESTPATLKGELEQGGKSKKGKGAGTKQKKAASPPAEAESGPTVADDAEGENKAD